MTILFQAKFLVLTFITLIGSAASSNETLIYTEPNKYQLFRISEDSYRLLLANYKKYGSTTKTYWGSYQFGIDDISLRPVLDEVCQEYNFSSLNTYSLDAESGGKLSVYMSCKKKVDPVELAKKIKQKEADRLAYKKEQEKKELKKREAEALQKRKEEERKRQRAEQERKKQQAIIDLQSKRITIAMGSGFWFNTDGYYAHSVLGLAAGSLLGVSRREVVRDIEGSEPRVLEEVPHAVRHLAIAMQPCKVSYAPHQCLRGGQWSPSGPSMSAKC